MRIVDVNEFYSPTGGGVRTYIDRKIGIMADLGHELTVIAPALEDGVEDRPGGGGAAGKAKAADNRFFGLSLRTSRWRYTEWAEGEKGRELYDHSTDPRETKNLAEDPTLASTVQRLAAQLKEGWRAATPRSVSQRFHLSCARSSGTSSR